MTASGKAIGFWRGWALVVGGTIGSGIFLLPTLLAPYGMLGLAGWLIAGAGALILSLMLADLSARLPKIGGPYAWARAGFGDFIGFWIGWGYWIAIWSATAAIAVACTGYLAFFFPVLKTSPALSAVVTLSLIWGLVLINVRSMASTGSFQLVTTLLKILPLLFVGILGFSSGSTGNLPELNPSGEPALAVIVTSVTLVMWAFVGLEGGTIPADDMDDPRRNIPRILVAGTLTVLFVYVLSCIGVLLLLPDSQRIGSTAPFADAAVNAIGHTGASVIATGAIISTLGALNAQILLSGQIVRAVALDHLFPPRLGMLGKGGTPATAILVSALLASALVGMNYSRTLVEAFNTMILLSTLTTLIPLAFAAVTAMMFARVEAGGSRRAMAVAALAFLYSLLVIAGAGADTVFYGFLLLIAAMPVYVFVRRKPAL